jgi:hypothetical protein
MSFLVPSLRYWAEPCQFSKLSILRYLRQINHSVYSQGQCAHGFFQSLNRGDFSMFDQQKRINIASSVCSRFVRDGVTAKEHTDSPIGGIMNAQSNFERSVTECTSPPCGSAISAD